MRILLSGWIHHLLKNHAVHMHKYDSQMLLLPYPVHPSSEYCYESEPHCLYELRKGSMGKYHSLLLLQFSVHWSRFHQPVHLILHNLKLLLPVYAWQSLQLHLRDVLLLRIRLLQFYLPSNSIHLHD